MTADGDRARWPAVMPPRGRALSPAVDRVDFAALAKAETPFTRPITQFYKEVTSPDSGLHAFISGDVQDIACYSGPFHYLLMRVHIQNEGVPIVWLRLDMWGTIKFSSDRSKLWKPRDYHDATTTFATLNFRHIIDFINDLGTMPGLRHSWTVNHVIGILHGGFGGFWVKPPSPKSLKSTLNNFVWDVATTESVERQFAIRHRNIKRISLRDPATWKNEPASLSQPPSSKEDGPEGADATLVGTKEKIAHIDSTLTLSDEHLQGPRPIQPPNANGAVPALATDAEKNVGDQPRRREIKHSNVLASKPVESPTPYDPYRRSASRTRNPLSGQTERRLVQPADPSSTPTRPTAASTGIDEAILQGIVITAPSAEGSGQGSHASPPFTNPQPSPPETPNLTSRIVRLGSSPMATGGYSSVWRGRLLSATSDDPDQALQAAVKVLRASYTDEDTLKRKLHKHLHVEMRIWAQLHHENVVRLLGHTEEPEGPGLVSILYPHGNVLRFLAKNPNVNREVICADVALGLQYLHEHKPRIIHGDLKGSNVLIDGEGRASICDFGLSIILDGELTGYTSSNFGGSLRFLAPELLEETTRTVQTDIYAYACTCIQILFDQEPYHEISREAHLMRAIFSHQPPFEPWNGEVTFPSLLRILKRCWDHDRTSRPPLNLIIDTMQRCLFRTYRTNLGIHQGIGRRVRLMCLPGIEQANLISIDDGGLSIVVNSSTSFHRVPIYQRYRWELMDNESLDNSGGSDASSLSGKDASSSESLPYISTWANYSVKFRLPYSSMVSYKSYHKASS